MKEEYTIENGYLPYKSDLANSVQTEESQKNYLMYKDENQKEKYLRLLTAKGFLNNLDYQTLKTKEHMIKIIKKVHFANNDKDAYSFLDSIVGQEFIYREYVEGWDYYESNGTKVQKSFQIKLMKTDDNKKYYNVKLRSYAFSLDD